MKYETKELAGLALEFAAHKAMGTFDDPANGAEGLTLADYVDVGGGFALDWETCGPIIERESISIDAFNEYDRKNWWATKANGKRPRIWAASGPTPLVAAMRCLVFAKLGAEVDL